MKRFYFKGYANTVVSKQANAIPKNFFKVKKQEQALLDMLVKEYEQEQANKFANIEDEQMLLKIGG